MAKIYSSKKKPKKIAFSEKTKKIIIITVAGTALIGGGWWAYMTFSTVPPPPLVANSPPEKAEEIAAYLGNSRGFGRLPIEQQEQYLVRAYQTFGQDPEARARYVQALRRMSSDERAVLENAVFDITREHVMEHAREYSSLPTSQREAYLDKAVKQMEFMRAQIGSGGPTRSLSDPLKGALPTRADEVMKMVYTKTNPTERAKAMPFIDAMAARYKPSPHK